MASPYPEGLSNYIGKHKAELPSPSVVLSLPIIRENVRVFHESCAASQISFRAHVKTNKTVELTRILLGEATTKVIVSTLREARGLKPLIEEGLVTEILYGMPVGPSMLPELHQLSQTVTTRLIVDNPAHIALLETSHRQSQSKNNDAWSVFIKVDMGACRAGLPRGSRALAELIRLVEESPNITLYGFYAYASHAHCTQSVQDAEGHLQEQIVEMLKVMQLVRNKSAPLVLSVGSSPTARVVQCIKEIIPSHITFEIHAGSVIFNDLQQLATGTLKGMSGLAMTVISEICSVYPHRNQALISAGVLALTREPQPHSLPGIARVRSLEKPSWIVDRVSQEHGIISYNGSDGRQVQQDWHLGDKVELEIQHSCIAGAMYGWYFITDEKGIVRDIYYPWKWW